MPEALFGKAKCFECSSELTKALEVINQAVVLYSGFVPALLEKMKIHLAMSDWDQMLDSCNRFVDRKFLIMRSNQYGTLLKDSTPQGVIPGCKLHRSPRPHCSSPGLQERGLQRSEPSTGVVLVVRNPFFFACHSPWSLTAGYDQPQSVYVSLGSL